jgi:colanic acid/amylovoran biosynthesis glycosyltransferase
MNELRLAYLVKKFPRLSETFVLNEILGQEALGESLRVFARRPADDEPRQPQFARLCAEVELVPPASQIDLWQDLFGPEGAALLPLVQGVVEESRPLGHARLPALIAEAVWLRRRAAELGLRHVHVHFATEAAVTAMLLAALGGPSYSVTAHAKDIYRDTLNVPLLAAIVERSAFTVTVCDANVRHMSGMLGARAAARIKRLYNGIDLESFRPGGARRRERHVLSVGRLVEKKGFDVLIDSFTRLLARGVDFTATLVGEGEEREAIRARIEAAGLASRVELAGALDQARVRTLMQEATLLCLPCKIGADGNRDALPTVLLEALASGLPCISTPVTGIPEILDDGRCGQLVPEDDVPATARAIECLFADPALRAAHAASGRRRAEQLFDARASARTLHGWFESALERERAGAA